MLKTSLLFAMAFQLQGDAVDPSPDVDVRASTRGPVAATYVGSARELDVAPPLMVDPGIRIDGRLDDPAWARAAVLTGFTQYEPVEGSAASEHTEVRLLMTDEALYFSIRADDAGGGVRATLTERDGYGRSDDHVRVILDTFDDRRRAYVFMVNPLGVQGDGLWVEGGGGRGDPIDWSPDFLWESDGRVDEGGFSAEMRIPLKSLRFPALDVQDWGLQIQRSIRRTGYAQSWAPISSEHASRLGQSGSIRGLRGLDAGLFLEINPTVVGSRTGSFDDDRGRLEHTPASGDVGLNLTYGLTSNLTLDGTVNPDFSQIEADAGQIAVNERFAAYLPERRPFFLEGADIFRMPRQLVYTRSISSPVGAAKISGKVGSFHVAYLGAVDDGGDGASQPIVNLMRVKRDVGASSSVGAVYTDRTTPGEGANRVLGADARLVLGGRYTVEVLAAGSADGAFGTDGASATDGASGTDGASEIGGASRGATHYGSLIRVEADRSSRSLSLGASFEDVGEDFRAGSGFIRRSGVTQVRAGSGYTFRGSRGALVERWGPSFDAEGTWNRSDFWGGRSPLETELALGFDATFRGNVGVFLNYRRSAYGFEAEEYDGFFSGPSDDALTPFASESSRYSGLHALSLRSWVNRWERVRISMGGGWSETPLFSSGLAVDLGERWNGDVGLTLYPTGSMQAGIGARHVSIFRQVDGSRYSSATIPRLQMRYQLTRALFVRGIGEYASQERGDLLDAATGDPVYRCWDGGCTAQTGSEAHDFSVEALLAYEPSPGTVVFLGYTRQFRDTSAFRFEQLRAAADGLFVKLSYRFRM